jgi:hypothetical protein
LKRTKRQEVTPQDIVEIAALRRASNQWAWPPIDARKGGQEFCSVCEHGRKPRSHYATYGHLCECYGVDEKLVRAAVPKEPRERMAKIQVCLPADVYEKLKLHDPGVSGAARELILAGVKAGGLRFLRHQSELVPTSPIDTPQNEA